MPIIFSSPQGIGEIDYKDNNADSDERQVNALAQTDNLFEINIDFEL